MFSRAGLGVFPNVKVDSVFATMLRETEVSKKGQMDKTIVDFRAANPDFVTGYESNRIIIDPATTSTKLTGTVINIADEKPIKDATITATSTTGQATGVSKSTTTSSTGKYTLKPLPPGDYSITVEAEGFQTHTETQCHATLGTNNYLDVGN